MARYPFQEIEKKWQDYWEKNKTFKVSEDASFPKEKRRYVLDMFPYPSAQGLHVGHPEGYTATDIYCRYLKMNGYNVLHPMGYDAFGLPAENYAIKTGTHPSKTTNENIDHFTKQIKSFGFCYDWDRCVSTCTPDYYRWTQWIFLQLYKRGLAYEAETPINWCTSCLTGLANEEVKDGRCDRCGNLVTRKTIRQWILKITAYAERLLADLDSLDWSDSIKLMQKNWIGKSTGAEVIFSIADKNGSQTENTLKIYTTRADTLYGATYMVLAPEHPLLESLTTGEQKKAVNEYVKQAAMKSDLERTDLAKNKTGVFTGSYAINPVNDALIPIWVSDYILISYGTGAIMAVPAHDERDQEFAQKFNLPIIKVVAKPQEVEAIGGETKIREALENNRLDEFAKNHQSLFTELSDCFVDEGFSVNSGEFTGLSTKDATEGIIAKLAKKGLAEKATNYKLRDWVFSRQRYWGEPIPLVHCEKCGIVAIPESELPLELPNVKSYQPTGTGESPLAGITDWVNTTCPSCGGKAKRETNTMPQWAGSCWYYLRFLDPQNNKEFASQEAIDYWMPVDLYVGGAEHAVLHLLYARFWHKVLYDLGLVNTTEPFQRLVNQGMITSFAFQRANKMLVATDMVTENSDGTFTDNETGEKLERVIAKMSKSLKNVINPDDVIRDYGADSVRLYEMFMGPLEVSKPWSTQGLIGVHRFLEKVWALSEKPFADIDLDTSKDKTLMEIRKTFHKTIKKVTEDTANLCFNTAISQMMIFVNEVSKLNEIPKTMFSDFLKLLNVYAPHLGEELWEKLGNTTSVSKEIWPSFNEEYCKDDSVTIIVQVNGKIRDKFETALNTEKETLEKQALSCSGVQKYLEGNSVKKIIAVPNKIVNIVV